MTRIERLLCRVGIHKWAAWESTEVPLVPILDFEEAMVLDDSIFKSEELGIETRTRTCKRCGRGEVATILHW